jgi:hypothetical protein
MRIALLASLLWLQGVEGYKSQLRDSIASHQVEKAEEAIAKLVEKNSEPAAEALLSAALAVYKSFADLAKDSAKLQQIHRRTFADYQKSSDSNEQAEFRDKLNDLEKRIFTLEIHLNRASLIQERLTLALTEFSDPKAVAAILDRLQSSPDWPIRAITSLALSLSPQGDFNAVTQALLERLKKEKIPNVVVALMEGLRKRQDKRAEIVAALIELLKSEHWQIVVTAAKYLDDIEDKSATKPLIDALERTDGRIRSDLHQSLVKLTGVQRSEDPEAWKAWWKENGAPFVEGQYVPPPGERAEPSRRGEFFGLPVHSRNVIFILDRSDSMREELVWPLTDDDRSVLDQIAAPGKSKIEIARFQVKKALLRLPPKTRFNILYYNEATRLFSDEMATLDDKTRKKAFDFIDSVQPSGGTDLHLALGTALAYARDSDGLLRREGADTLFLLSDGLPNSGQVTSADRILSRLWTQNIINRMDIHTVYTGKDRGKGLDLMKEIAKRNNGRCVFR